jgi:hypothetical protein
MENLAPPMASRFIPNELRAHASGDTDTNDEARAEPPLGRKRSCRHEHKISGNRQAELSSEYNKSQRRIADGR